MSTPILSPANAPSVIALVCLLWDCLDNQQVQTSQPWPWGSVDFSACGIAQVNIKGDTGLVSISFSKSGTPVILGTIDYTELEALLKTANAENTLIASSASLTLAAQNTFYKVDGGGAWVQDKAPVGMACAATGEITCETAGRFFIAASLSVKSPGATATVKFQIFKNGNPIASHSATTWVDTTSYPNAVTVSGIDDLQVGDVVDLRVECETTTGTVITVTDANLAMFAIA